MNQSPMFILFLLACLYGVVIVVLVRLFRGR
jgi:hypothetical protein